MKKFLHPILMTLLCAITATAMPVEDITLKYVTPKEGELDLSLRSLDQITLTFSQAVEADPDKLATLTLPNGETLTSKLTVNHYMKNTVILNFPDVQHLNGKYTLTIKRWSVGDAEWIENYEAGHSNAKIEVEWTVSNGLETGVSFTAQLEDSKQYPIRALPNAYAQPLASVNIWCGS